MKSVTAKLGALAFFTCLLAACGGGSGGGGGGGSVPTSPPTPTPTPNGTVCVPNGQSAVRNPMSAASYGADGSLHVMPGRAGAPYVPGQLAVQYRTSQLSSIDRALASLTSGASNDVVADLHYPRTDLATRIVRVDPSKIDETATSLRQAAGVIRVDRVAAKYEMASTPAYLNDPYFFGQNTTPAGQPGAPLFASPTYPGQWDMHIIGMENVFGYKNGAPGVAANPNVLGNANVKVAIIDTGADISLTDIGPATSPRIARTECYITPSSGAQTNTQNVSDFDGHGTNVTGIAAANTNNGYGFVGSGGNVSLMLYRIFPSGANTSASAADEATAINDAVAHGANVISLSLGSTGADPTEMAAIEAAITAGVVVVAASGNETATALDYPAGYAGVIAVGASAINDSGVERVASYSNYVPGSNTWGLIAPGGDPTGNTDGDFLHWIENTYSLRASQPCRAATGGLDFFGESGNCNVLIAGTSQATPHVAGAVAMLLSVTPGLTPATVKNLLFASAHDIGDPKEGAGRLNEYLLVANALNDPSPPTK